MGTPALRAARPGSDRPSPDADGLGAGRAAAHAEAVGSYAAATFWTATSSCPGAAERHQDSAGKVCGASTGRGGRGVPGMAGRRGAGHVGHRRQRPAAARLRDRESAVAAGVRAGLLRAEHGVQLRLQVLLPGAERVRRAGLARAGAHPRRHARRRRPVAPADRRRADHRQAVPGYLRAGLQPRHDARSPHQRVPGCPALRCSGCSRPARRTASR